MKIFQRSHYKKRHISKLLVGFLPETVFLLPDVICELLRRKLSYHEKIFIKIHVHLNNFDKYFISFHLQNSITFIKMIEEPFLDKFEAKIG